MNNGQVWNAGHTLIYAIQIPIWQILSDIQLNPLYRGPLFRSPEVKLLLKTRGLLDFCTVQIMAKTIMGEQIMGKSSFRPISTNRKY